MNLTEYRLALLNAHADYRDRIETASTKFNEDIAQANIEFIGEGFVPVSEKEEKAEPKRARGGSRYPMDNE